MRFIYKVTRGGIRLIRAVQHRDGNDYSSDWHVLPSQGMGIEQRRDARAQALERAREDCQDRVAQVYGGTNK